MKVLKGFLIAILSLLLFLSLIIFGVAFLFNSTLLNPNFVSSQVEKADISALVTEIAEEQIGDELPEDLLFVKEAVYDVVAEQEPWIKEQLDIAIHTGYDYLLSKSDVLEITIPLETLKESLRDSLWREFKEQLPLWLPELVDSDLIPYIDQYIDELVEQIPQEYLPLEAMGLSEEDLKPYLHEYLREIVDDIINENYTPEVSGLLEGLVRPYFNHYYDDYIGEIPSELTFNENDIPSEVMEQLVLARGYIRDFITGYYALMGFMVLLLACIILVHRNVRGSTRTLGINFLIYGIIAFASVLALRNIIPGLLPSDIPSALDTWLTPFIGDFFAPLQWFSLSVLIAGVILLVVSFVYKRRASEDEITVPDTDTE
jgi:hypothetical protein